jgi:hypothetical protein
VFDLAYPFRDHASNPFLSAKTSVTYLIHKLYNFGLKPSDDVCFNSRLSQKYYKAIIPLLEGG